LLGVQKLRVWLMTLRKVESFRAPHKIVWGDLSIVPAV